jgi:hypothetical protein
MEFFIAGICMNVVLKRVAQVTLLEMTSKIWLLCISEF